MSAHKIIVSCSQGHRFPVNLLKHTDRAHVFCPRCRDKVKVRKEHFFSPNPEWSKEKERRREATLTMKAMGKRAPPPMAFPEELAMRQGILMTPLMAKLLYEAKKRAEEKKKS